MSNIKVAIIGLGNCASSLIQGIYYYKNKTPEEAIGLMHFSLGGYLPQDIEIVAAFDIDERKIGKDVSEAIFAKPNCTTVFCKDIPKLNVKVKMGKILDGFSEHLSDYPEDERFFIAEEKEATKESVIEELKNSKAEILVNYLPVGSEQAVKFYTECALSANIAFINCMPVFIASSKEWSSRFEEKNLPIIGDDIKSQLGATITHRVLTDLFKKRGIKLERTYQLNTGGNTDFLNMLNRTRLKSKKISKTEAIQSAAAQRLEDKNIHVGPSDYVPWQKDNKICFLRMEGRQFGDVPMNIEARISVEDSPNSAGIVIDAIRCCRLALDRRHGGILEAPSAYFMKHPPKQIPDDLAHELVEQFIKENKN
jgi:myo-inositol-1-phosphate synthase